jgi:hypothetical protein
VFRRALGYDGSRPIHVTMWPYHLTLPYFLCRCRGRKIRPPPREAESHRIQRPSASSAQCHEILTAHFQIFLPGRERMRIQIRRISGGVG